jgi:hypothetical protein
MKETTLIILAIATTLLAAFAYGQHHQEVTDGPLAHVRNEFEFTVHASYAVTAPLFGPQGERGWAGEHWDPHFVYPQPAHDVRGAVFTVAHGHQHSYWVNTAFDLEERHIQYVYIIPDGMATLIDLRFSVIDSANTKVNVAYERTALTPEANDHVREAGTADSKNGPEWGKQINDYLAKQAANKTLPTSSAQPVRTAP